MEDYKVPKKKTSVLVEIPPHPAGLWFIFLSAFAQHHQGAETASDIFNTDQRFIPLFSEGGSLVLARRDSISWVQISEPATAEWRYFGTRMDAPQAGVRVDFNDGTSLEGRIALIGPLGSQRAIDVVNREEGFIHLERGEDLFLVNLRCVASITMREEANAGAR
jgi:hypothetical protein